MVAVVGEGQMPTMYQGTNLAISRLGETIRQLEDFELVRLFWIYRDCLPDSDITTILSVHEKRILNEVWNDV